jgi:hypothetical protein
MSDWERCDEGLVLGKGSFQPRDLIPVLARPRPDHDERRMLV